MEYKVLKSPFCYKSFTDMKKKEAQEYFEWYRSQIKDRIFLLREKLIEEGMLDILDYSEKSLIPLWEWYEKKIEIVFKDANEYQNELDQYPEWMKGQISNTKISYNTLKYALDVSIYFAEVVIKNSNGKIEWGYFTTPKKRMSVNEPVLLGFKNNIDMNPRQIILNATRRSSVERENTRLYDLYTTWKEYID